MKPFRQIEAAEYMTASGTYSVKFAKALLAVTRPGAGLWSLFPRNSSKPIPTEHE